MQDMADCGMALARIELVWDAGWKYPSAGIDRPLTYWSWATFEDDPNRDSGIWTLFIQLLAEPRENQTVFHAKVWFVSPEAPQHFLDQGKRFSLFRGAGNVVNAVGIVEANQHEDDVTETDDPSSRADSARVFTPYEPRADDLARVRALPATACPRRYCWWWRSLAFEWDVSAAEGCTFLESEKPPEWLNPDEPCVRACPTAHRDHFEPREPHLIEDGLLPVWFLRLDD